MQVREAMNSNPISIAPTANLAEAVATMDAHGIQRLPVLDATKLAGILCVDDLHRALPAVYPGLTPWQCAGRVGALDVAQAMKQPVFTVPPEAPVSQAITVMLDRRLGGLPVVDDSGHLVGILTKTDVLRAAARNARLRWGLVGQHMTVSTVSIGAGADATEGAARLREGGLKVLPVLDSEGGILVGVLHEKDVQAEAERQAVIRENPLLTGELSPKGGQVRDLMRPPGAHVSEEWPLRDAVTAMLGANVHGLPVITSDGELRGVITISDVLKTLLNTGSDALY